MLRDVLVRGYMAEDTPIKTSDRTSDKPELFMSGQSVICVTDRRGVDRREEALLTVRTFNLSHGSITLTTSGISHFPEIVDVIRSYELGPEVVERLGNILQDQEGGARLVIDHPNIIVKPIYNNKILRSPMQRLVTMTIMRQATKELGLDYVAVPEQYGYLILHGITYLFMEKIPGIKMSDYERTIRHTSGITVDQVTENMWEAINKMKRYFKLHVASSTKVSPDDLNHFNVLIDDTDPTKHFTFYFIDQ